MQNTGSGVVVLPQLTNLCYILVSDSRQHQPHQPAPETPLLTPAQTLTYSPTFPGHPLTRCLAQAKSKTVAGAEKFVGIDVQGNVDTVYCASLGMKINAKLGGVNALPKYPALEKL
ncbi:hypothetical protein AZE42_05041, partial [Rhizopogon vesiculosus]